MYSPAVPKYFLFFIFTVLGMHNLFSVTQWLMKIKTVNQMKVNFKITQMSKMCYRLTDLKFQ